MNSAISIPVCEKMLRTLKEAAAYSNIGRKKLKEIMSEPDCNFVLRKGDWALIKRKMFEDYLLNMEVI